MRVLPALLDPGIDDAEIACEGEDVTEVWA
jgi:hypothetical protein